MSDRIAVMDAGRVQQLSDPKTLYERPRTSFVADFIGTSNALSFLVDRRDGELAMLEPAPDVRIAVRHDCEVGETLDISVRPEKIRIRPEDGAAPGTGRPFPGGRRRRRARLPRVRLADDGRAAPAASASRSTSSTTTMPPSSSPAAACC